MKAGSIYYLEDDPDNPKGRPITHFVGASWDMKKNPEDPRKVLSFSLKGPNGTWPKLTKLEFENGVVIDMEDKTLLYKPAQPGQQAKKKNDDFSF